jgi:hypothetical protein
MSSGSNFTATQIEQSMHADAAQIAMLREYVATHDMSDAARVGQFNCRVSSKTRGELATRQLLQRARENGRAGEYAKLLDGEYDAGL